MTIELSFLTLKSAVMDYNSVVAFVDGHGLTDMLATIGDVHYEAAKDALNKRSISVSKRVPARSAAEGPQEVSQHWSQRPPASAALPLSAEQLRPGVRLPKLT